MSTRNVTGWLLIAGPILTFVVVGIIMPSAVGEADAGAGRVAERVANYQLTVAFLAVASPALVGTFIGLSLLARSMHGGDQSGAGYAAVAGIIFAGLAAIAIVATGNSVVAMNANVDGNASDAAMIDVVGNAMIAGMVFYWSIGYLLLGLCAVMQKSLPVISSWLLVAVGIVGILLWVIDVDVSDAVSLVLWLLLSLAAVVAGVSTLRSKQAS